MLIACIRQYNSIEYEDNLPEDDVLTKSAYVPVDLKINQSDSIFNTCNLILYDHLDPELIEFHYPGYNPKQVSSFALVFSCTSCRPLHMMICILELLALRTYNSAEGW